MQAALLLLLAATSWAGEAFGVWKLNPARSTGSSDQRTVTVRIEPHPRGEVFTLDTVAPDGRATTSSTILYFDGKSRKFQDSTCSGTQSSRRLDGQTVEILRACASGVQMRLIRQTLRPGLLILTITAQTSGGSRSERHLVMEKQ